MTNIDQFFLTAMGNRLRVLRKSKGLTQVQLSDILLERYHISIDSRSISRYETGRSLPETENLIYLSDFFEISTEYILYGKKTSDEDAFTWYDTFKRMNRLIYPLAVGFGKCFDDGKIYMELWDDAWKVYYERLQSFGVSQNYLFENKNVDPSFDVKDMDDLFLDFKSDKVQLSPTLERYNKYLVSQGINPEDFLRRRLEEIKSKQGK